MTVQGSYLKQLDDALAFISDSDHFLVVSHVQPDGDAISSTVAVGWLLQKLGKSAVLINESELPSRLSYLHQFDSIVNYKQAVPQQKFNAIISVDCADFKRIGEVASSFAPEAKLLNIDHHPTNNGFGTVNVIRAEAAATVEILFDLIERAGNFVGSELCNGYLHRFINRYGRLPLL